MNATVKRVAAREVSTALHRAHSAAELGRLSDRELLELIRQSPIPDQLAGEARAVRTERRRELVALKQRELAATEREMPAILRKCAEARAVMATKQTEFDAAKSALETAETERRTRDVRCRHTVAMIDVELELSAPEAIAAFIARIDSEWQQLRSCGQLTVVELRSRHPYGGVSDKTGADLSETSAENERTGLRMDGLLAARAKAEELKCTALDGEELAAALNEIEANMLELGRAARAARGQT